ncbi:response regulator transcription factor [Candidatus Villigracilis saccharophilus]|uniref:response regulator transcription factor n=1 Tax=Candidatus Villigracilis saccharophilus TaxID=3140684 RepID=UPI003135A6EE|nr:response regulator transcription factor [Anaerolineales bacterium]
MKILIVDDHVLFREGLAAIIRPQSDIEIVGMAGTVREAVDMARSAKPDIILMDFNLPDGSGVDATRRILEEQPTCKVVFLTMSEQDEDLFAAIRVGAKGYMLKNMHPPELVAALRSVQQGESALSRAMTLRLMDELSRTKKSIGRPAENTLTLRELDVLRAIASGMSNQEIGSHLFISENTVKFHVHSLLAKLNLSDRKEAASFAKEHGLVNRE